MVVDLSVEGVSLVNHYRQTFSRFLANKQFPDLLQQLKRKLGIHE
jgi:ABC-type transporter MlaC component